MIMDQNVITICYMKTEMWSNQAKEFHYNILLRLQVFLSVMAYIFMQVKSYKHYKWMDIYWLSNYYVLL